MVHRVILIVVSAFVIMLLYSLLKGQDDKGEQGETLWLF